MPRGIEWTDTQRGVAAAPVSLRLHALRAVAFGLAVLSVPAVLFGGPVWLGNRAHYLATPATQQAVAAASNDPCVSDRIRAQSRTGLVITNDNLMAINDACAVAGATAAEQKEHDEVLRKQSSALSN